MLKPDRPPASNERSDLACRCRLHVQRTKHMRRDARCCEKTGVVQIHVSSSAAIRCLLVYTSCPVRRPFRMCTVASMRVRSNPGQTIQPGDDDRTAGTKKHTHILRQSSPSSVYARTIQIGFNIAVNFHAVNTALILFCRCHLLRASFPGTCLSSLRSARPLARSLALAQNKALAARCSLQAVSPPPRRWP